MQTALQSLYTGVDRDSLVVSDAAVPLYQQTIVLETQLPLADYSQTCFNASADHRIVSTVPCLCVKRTFRPDRSPRHGSDENGRIGITTRVRYEAVHRLGSHLLCTGRSPKANGARSRRLETRLVRRLRVPVYGQDWA